MVRHGIEASKSVSGPSGVPGLLSWFPITGKVIRGNLQAVVSHLKTPWIRTEFPRCRIERTKLYIQKVRTSSKHPKCFPEVLLFCLEPMPMKDKARNKPILTDYVS